jgi:hypothetical protein
MAFNSTYAKTIWDRILLWIHGRRLGIFGDGQTSNNNYLVLDGVVVGSTRSGAAPSLGLGNGINGTGATTVTGTLVGDTVSMVLDMNAAPFVDVTSSFEAQVSVAGQVQQTVALAGTHSCLFFINPQAPV